MIECMFYALHGCTDNMKPISYWVVYCMFQVRHFVNEEDSFVLKSLSNLKFV